MLEAGFAQATITPPVGVELSGWAFGRSATVLEELQAQAAAISCGDTHAILICADLINFSRRVAETVRTRLENSTGIPGRSIVMSASHTHSGPAVARFRQWGEPDPGYIARLEDQLVDLGHRALNARNPVTMAGGTGQVDDCVENRRGIPGQVDPSVPVMRFDNPAGETQAVIWNFGCHPVALHNYRNAISPDFIGYARDEVRRQLGGHVVVMFTLGANGDTNPTGFIFGNPSIANAVRIGKTLGAEVVRVARILRPKDAGLQLAYRQYALPYVPLPSIDELRRMKAGGLAQAQEQRMSGRDLASISFGRITAEWADAAIAESEAGTSRAEGTYEIQALRIGDVGMVTNELETYSETALAVKNAFGAGRTIMLAGNCNAAGGYLPTADAYDKSDYTGPAGAAPKVYGIYAFDSKAEPICRQIMIDTLKQVFTEQ
jgi:hypothetical protein